MKNAEAGAAALLTAVLLIGAMPARAQDAPPDTQAMIRALRPASAPGDGTRLRNLVVRMKGSAASAAEASPAVAAAAAASASAPATATAAEPAQLSLALPFQPGSARLQVHSAGLLGHLVAALRSPELQAHRFAIEGHTDAQGQPAQNLRLSQARAEEVRRYLVTLGIAPARLVAVGKGASQPANPRDPLAAETRRVRVVTLP